MEARVGLWGTFDLENFGDMLFPRIAGAELASRLPGASLRAFSPFGYGRLNRFQEDDPAEPLGAWTPERAAHLAAELDCVVIGGGEIIHDHDELLAPHYGVSEKEMLARAPSRFFIDGLGPDLERETPVAWHAVGIPFDPTPGQAERLRAALSGREYVSVRDERSRRRLEAAGVEREIVVVPDSAFLVPRLYPAPEIEGRIGELRARGWYPPEGSPLVVQANRDLIPEVPALAASIADVCSRSGKTAAVLVETGPCHGDDAFAAELARALPLRSRRLGIEAGMAGLVAAIAGSAGFVGSSLHGNILAVAYGRPHVILDAGGQSKLAAFAELVSGDLVADPAGIPEAFERSAARGPREGDLAALHARIDAHFDRIAGIAESAAVRPGRPAVPPPETAPVLPSPGRAERARGGSASERSALADRAVDLEREAARVRAESESEVERLRGQVSQLEESIGGLQGRAEDLAGRLGDAEARARASEEDLARLLASRSVRYTAPLRAFHRWLRRLRGR